MTTVDVRYLTMTAMFCRRALECGRCLADSVLATSWRGRGGVTIRRHDEYFLIVHVTNLIAYFLCFIFF